jgi:GNAT superfamily N-acetyltransferase
MEESDLGAADGLMRAAFERSTSFLEHLQLSLQLEPDGLLAAEESGRVVGMVGAVDYGAIAYIGLMAVDPNRQGRGIGRMLMERLLAWLDDRKCPMALLDATDKGARLYETLGFVEDSMAYVFERVVETPRAPPDKPAPGNFIVRPASGDDLAELAVFDTPVFGADRSVLFAAVWPEFRARCRVARDGSGRLTGYLFVRGSQLGPWAAADGATAEQLLSAALQFSFDAPPHVLVPRGNRACIELLSRHYFVERRRLRHMRRGGDGPPGVPARLFGQSSFAHG